MHLSSKLNASPRHPSRDLIDKIYASDLVDRKQIKQNRYKSQLSKYTTSNADINFKDGSIQQNSVTDDFIPTSRSSFQ